MLALAVALVMAQGISGYAQPPCDVRSGLITNRAIGPFPLGESVAALRRRCPFVRDTVFQVTGEFPATIHALLASVRGVPVTLSIKDGKVTVISVSQPGLATADGLEVGTSISRFRTMRGVEVQVSDYGPGVTLSLAGRCGLLFDLSDWGQTPPETADVPLSVRHHELDAWSASIHVTYISVVAGLCPENRRGTSRPMTSAFVSPAAHVGVLAPGAGEGVVEASFTSLWVSEHTPIIDQSWPINRSNQRIWGTEPAQSGRALSLLPLIAHSTRTSLPLPSPTPLPPPSPTSLALSTPTPTQHSHSMALQP